MFKVFVFLLLVLASFLSFTTMSGTLDADCPPPAKLQKTGSTSTSISYSWSGSPDAGVYRVWYVRQEDEYTSAYFYTTGTAFTFTGLTPGHYTFYFTGICDGGESGLVGSEDLLQA